MDKRAVKRLFGIHRTAIGLRLGEGLMFEAWVAEMRRASRERSASLWQIGDLLLFGAQHYEDEPRYGEMYKRAITETGLSYSRLANIKSVCAKIEFSRRRENLSFGHHEEVASLPEAEQDRLLDLAANAGWSRAVLREEVAKAQTGAAYKQGLTGPIYKQGISGPVHKKIRAYVEHRPISSAIPPPQTTSRPALSPTSKALLDATVAKQRLADARRELAAWLDRYGGIIDAVATGGVQDALYAIERSLSALSTTEAAPEPSPERLLH